MMLLEVGTYRVRYKIWLIAIENTMILLNKQLIQIYFKHPKII